MSNFEIPRCQHIKADGVQCKSLAMRGRSFCYFHAEMRDRARRRAKTAKPDRGFPVLEDANSIQVALMQTIDDLRHKRIDRGEASLILYALQTASMNLRRTNFEPFALRNSSD